MIMEKSSLVHQIKEKIFPCDDVYFEWFKGSEILFL